MQAEFCSRRRNSKNCGNRPRLSAIELRFEPVLQRSRKRPQARWNDENRLALARWIPRNSFSIAGRSTPVQRPPVTISRPSTTTSCSSDALPRANSNVSDGIAIGNPADLVVLDTDSGRNAIAELPEVLMGFKNGRQVFE